MYKFHVVSTLILKWVTLVATQGYICKQLFKGMVGHQMEIQEVVWGKPTISKRCEEHFCGEMTGDCKSNQILFKKGHRLLLSDWGSGRGSFSRYRTFWREKCNHNHTQMCAGLRTVDVKKDRSQGYVSMMAAQGELWRCWWSGKWGAPHPGLTSRG